MFEKIAVPSLGFKDGADGELITELAVAVGARDVNSTELFVRGTFLYIGRKTPFNGIVVLREDRDSLDHDLRIYTGGDAYSKSTVNALAVSVILCLDAHAEELMAGEAERIVG